MNYKEMLKRCRDSIPVKGIQKERLEIPAPIIISTKKNLTIKNFRDISDIVNRDAKSFARFLFRTLAVPGYINNKELVLQGRVNPALVRSRINEYMKKYVYCEECGKADTVMIKDGKNFIIKCEACGARRVVK